MANDPIYELRMVSLWLRRYLDHLVHVSVADKNGGFGNGFAAAQIPDWDIRQRLALIEAALHYCEEEPHA